MLIPAVCGAGVGEVPPVEGAGAAGDAGADDDGDDEVDGDGAVDAALSPEPPPRVRAAISPMAAMPARILPPEAVFSTDSVVAADVGLSAEAGRAQAPPNDVARRHRMRKAGSSLIRIDVLGIESPF